MHTAEIIKKELKNLIEKQADLLELARDDMDLRKFGTAYQDWYSQAYKLVEALAPERLAEFASYYLIDPKRALATAGNYVIQDYIKGIAARTNFDGEPVWNTNHIATMRFINQTQILAALSSRVESVLQDVTGHLFAELQVSELSAAVQLKKVSRRAAGALAGVVLERHLQRVATNHQISIPKKNPTVSVLNDPLKNKGVYDVKIWRKIQSLADIRNDCAHLKTSEPTGEQVDELISGVSSVIKSVF